jgi:hypothetical protein
MTDVRKFSRDFELETSGQSKPPAGLYVCDARCEPLRNEFDNGIIVARDIDPVPLHRHPGSRRHSLRPSSLAVVITSTNCS